MTEVLARDDRGRLAGTKPRPRPVFDCECGDHCFVRLSAWGVTLVSPEDADLLRERAWHEHAPYKDRPYVAYARSRRKRLVIYLHTEIMRPPAGLEPDHSEGWTLDNRRGSLRLLTRGQNNRNRQAPPKTASGYRGVYFHKHSGLWHARYTSESGKVVSLGYFKDPAEGARVRDAAVKDAFPGIQSLNQGVK